jgi:hypothetical protein
VISLGRLEALAEALLRSMLQQLLFDTQPTQHSQGLKLLLHIVWT